MKKLATDWDKIFANNTFYKHLVFVMHKNYNSTIK